ncbi:MAG: hypothetical protein GC147_02060 [Porphyrobacter sp.]|nr:hypothetical protein [Porphyrobacter sp.]
MFYLHIPKTGGQTLARRLASAFPPGRSHLQVGQFTYPADCAAFTDCLAEHDFVEAHVTGQLLEDRPVEDLLVTVREPVAQIISNFRHIRREPDRRLSRAARELDPGAFFDHFGDFFTNFQTRYLLSAFLPLGIEEQRRGYWPTAAHHLPKVLDKIRWLLPTDRIDAFVPLWEAETGRRAAERGFATNHAPADDVDLGALEAAIRARPGLFALDSVLYQYACARHAEWVAAVQQQVAPWDYPSNASRVFHDEGGGVWLRSGWYPSEETAIGPGNWAGPSRRSDVAVKRGPGQDALVFDVIVINGITFDDITAYTAEGFEPLPIRREEVSRDRWRYRVDLSALPDSCSVALMVPNCFAAINVFGDGEDAGLERRSFLAAGWGLERMAAASRPASVQEAA